MCPKLTSVAVADCEEVLAAWDQICRSLELSRHIFLFTDFDGTLSPIVPVPGTALIDPGAKESLRQLNAEKTITTALLSGRSVSDLMSRVGLPIIYAGDHGLEIQGPGFEFLAPGAEALALELPPLCDRIQHAIRHIPGAIVELKRFTASVHFRQVAPEHVPAVMDAVHTFGASSRFEIRNGDCVLELRPRLNWNKGDAVRWILDKYGATGEQAICIGDDLTDEDMFRKVPEGVNVKVLRGDPSDTAARYCLRQPEVAGFLHGIVDLIQGMT
jgi:alpha,alpha-trehalase